ncbi:MAG: S-adenosylmethionine:tRNA ribosyltransferase-isomerase [Bacteroidales bacterium]|nr:S-adenosylmethionine:tRNA ribosyltransferase-isomerase [Bacteroidales bacterium]
MPVPDIHPEDYTYDLPSDRIAQYPLPERDASRLICSIGSTLKEDIFRNIANYIPAGSMLVMNNTRVIRARLIFQKASGASIEVFCLESLEPTKDVSQAFQQQGPVVWKCLIGNAKRWKSGILEQSVNISGKIVTLQAERKSELERGTFSVMFTWNNAATTFGELLEETGRTPLPPYILRQDEQVDFLRYQTIYAQQKGSVAAPTAGFHFTEAVINSLKAKTILLEQVTLHVGLGTFRPVSVNSIEQHVMHQEQIIVEADTIRHLRDHLPKPVIAIGTTTVRTLESLYWLGVKEYKDPGGNQTGVDQWEPYPDTDEPMIPPEEALNALLRKMKQRGLSALSATTKLIIVPGYQFRIISGMVTNFHQPRSTLLMLIAAFLGESWKEVYHYSLENNFRFLSYGDSCLFLR